ncbi:MAG: outer membrane beta-barrel protein [Saprospiraceae bacterium]|nr:outer membrane beta-barrel protein [Saprospiraceae bacterium]
MKPPTPLNISAGNPYLDPEFTDNYEVSAKGST